MNTSTPRASKPKNVPKGFVSTVTDVLEHQIHSLSSGSDSGLSPVVLIHGALASRRYLIPTAAVLAKQCMVHIPELPGHGASSKPRVALSVQEQCDVLRTWLKIQGLQRVNLYANSYGCQIVALFAATYPDLVDNLILSGPTVDPSGPTLIEQYRRLNVDGFLEPPTSQLNLLLDLMDMGIVRAFQTANRMMENDIKPNLQNITCPALVVRGEGDPIAPQRWCEQAAALLPHGQLRVIPHAAHCINFSKPKELSSIIVQFLSGQ